MMIRRILIPLVLFAFAASSVTCLAAKPKKQAHKVLPVVVEAGPATAVKWQPRIMATGTLVAEQGITVRSEVAGRITQLFFKSGDVVKAGTPLLRIYPDILLAQLKSNEAALKLKKLNFARISSLYKKNAVSKSQLDTTASELQSSQAQVDQTQAQLTQTLIKAPFAGVLGIRKVSLGDYVTAGQAIVNLQDVDPIFVDFSVSEKHMKQVAIGEKLTVYSSAYGKQRFVGKVVAMESLIDPSTRTILVRAAIPNKNRVLIPGSFVEVKLALGKSETIVSIPQTAIVYSPGGDFVYKVIGGKAIKTSVVLGTRGVTNIFIKKGLSPGDVVVTAGQQKLHDKALVKIVKSP